MAVTPKRLFGPAQLTNTTATKYTVPSSTKAIIREIHLSNPGAVITLTMSIGSDAAGVRMFDGYSIPAAAAGQPASVRIIPVYWVLTAAEIIAAHASVGSQLVLTLFGDEITL
jgi:hypothetical protein